MKRVLVISPHPDDEAIGCGGTLRRHVLDGDLVRVLFLTSGEAGGHGIADPAGIREREAQAAAKILGLADIEFWREPDGALRATRLLVERLRRLLERQPPDVLYAPHHGERHADHRAAARLVRSALDALDGTLPAVFLYEVWTPLHRLDRIVDITQAMETKLAAIRAYRSQCDAMRFDDAFTGLARYRGEMFSWPERGYAEVFAAGLGKGRGRRATTSASGRHGSRRGTGGSRRGTSAG